MDKDLLRIVIISVGAVVILGMILWGMFKGGSKRKNINFYDDGDPLEHVNRSLFVNTDDDDFDIVPLKSRGQDDYQIPEVKARLNPEYIQEAKQQEGGASESDILAEAMNKVDEPLSASVKKQLPALLQVHLVAQNKKGFNGLQLLQAFERVGLVYGSVKVFERLDAQNRVDYAVASMVEPGIFPDDNWESYYCPGISFFMQPRELDDANAVFDDLINTVGQLSALLDGDILDGNYLPLTDEIALRIEQSLS
ncbi:MAG: cell division protein [Methylococcaceae bacterium]|nr:cell division protein [Methylococcaceae bacterium]